MQKQKKYVKKWAAGLCALSLLAGLLSGCAARQAADTGDENLPAIIVGCDDYTPFSYLDANGNMTGIDVELAREAFRRMGYRAECRIISWEEKKALLEAGTIDCVWSSFTMDGREDEYQWAGPYMKSHQVVAVDVNSSIQTLQDLKGKVIAVQSTTKPEDIIRSHDGTLPELQEELQKAGFNIERWTERDATVRKEGEEKAIRLSTLAKQFGWQYSMSALQRRLMGEEIELPEPSEPAASAEASEWRRYQAWAFEQRPASLKMKRQANLLAQSVWYNKDPARAAAKALTLLALQHREQYEKECRGEQLMEAGFAEGLKEVEEGGKAQELGVRPPLTVQLLQQQRERNKQQGPEQTNYQRQEESKHEYSENNLWRELDG